MATGPHRLFFALVPDAEASRRIAAFAAALRARYPGGGWVDPERYHATLAFLGEWHEPPDAIAARARDAAGRVQAAAFTAGFATLASFGGARAVWMLAGDAAPWLPLVDALRAALAATSLAFDGRAFVPHLTLRRARVRPPTQPLAAPVAWHARDFVLLRSDPGEAQYTTLARWPLA